MITFSRLEKKGNLGNQLFQIASTAGIARANRHDFAFPAWKHNRFFKNQLPVAGHGNFTNLREKQFHFAPIEVGEGNYDLEGWLQSEKYFDREFTRQLFEFDPKLLQEIKQKYSAVFSKKVILLSIRRGDFVDHPDYFQLPINYYMNALIDCFPDWRSRNIVLASDDMAYCRFHFSFLENAFFCESLSAGEQLAFSSLCDDFIISNSTFSWWCAWFGEKPGSTVVRPLHNFTPAKNAADNDRDYFPERWKVYDHDCKLCDLGNTAIALRSTNDIVVEYLQHNFSFGQKSTPILYDGESTLEVLRSESLLFIDDCILPPMAIYLLAVNAEHGKTSEMKLLGGYTLISRGLDYRIFSKQFDFGIFTRIFTANRRQTHRRLALGIPKGSTQQSISIGEKIRPAECLYCQAGKISVFGVNYFLSVRKRNLVRTVKRTIKQILKRKRS